MNNLGHHTQIQFMPIMILGGDGVFLERSRYGCPSQNYILVIVESVRTSLPIRIPVLELSVRRHPRGNDYIVAVHPVANQSHSYVTRTESCVGNLNIALYIAGNIIFHRHIHLIRDAQGKGVAPVRLEFAA